MKELIPNVTVPEGQSGPWKVETVLRDQFAGQALIGFLASGCQNISFKERERLINCTIKP